MIEKGIVVAVVLLGAALAYAATKPDTFRVERTVSIQAPPEEIFTHINDFRRWRAWSPWEKLDPAMKRTTSGPPAGMGAVYVWQGDGNVGSGRMEIIESIVPSRVRIQLDFFEPFEAHNTAELTLESEGAGTRVTWTMYGPQSYPAKVLHLVFDMDRMVGDQFEEGLTNLRMLTEN